MKIKLHSQQGTVFRSTSRFKVVAAGRRWGKTVMACTIIFYEALRHKDRVYWLVAPTYGQAKDLAWDKILLKMIPPEIMAKPPNETELKITLKTGSTISLKGADNPDTLVGRGLSGLIIDEVAKIRHNKRVWEEILRPSLTDYEGFCIFISTPQGKDYFWEMWMKGQRKEDGYESWRFKTEDNPFIPRSEIKAYRNTVTEKYFKQEYEASFEDYVGLIWPEFDGKLIHPFAIPEHWESIGIIDPAITGTTAALFLRIDEDGNIYVVGEYYEPDKRVSEICASIKHRANSWIIDPAAKGIKTAQDGKVYSLFDEYMEHGIIAMTGENDVEAGINRVAEYFKSSKIRIFNTCKNLIYELERYHWSEEKETVNGILRPKPFKALDHLCDCLRYGIMSRPSAGFFKLLIKENTFDYFEQMEGKQRDFQERMAQI